MKDVQIVPEGSTPAERAVSYLLVRLCHDADLRWYLLNTQAFALLCEAEAARTGKTLDEVEESVRRQGTDDVPEVTKLRCRLINLGITDA